MVERVQEDERLRGDLPDDAATALVEWASERVAAAAADLTRPDAQVEAEVQAIRAAARAAARAGETDPQRLLAQAETELAQRIATAAQPAVAAPVAEQPAPPSPASEQPAVAAPVAEQPAPPSPIADLAAAVGAGAARSQAPPVQPSQPPPQAEQSDREQQPPSPRRWNPFAGFLKRIRGGR
jgi:hypothetical protein